MIRPLRKIPFSLIISLLLLTACGNKERAEVGPPGMSAPGYTRSSVEIMSTVVEVVLPDDRNASAHADTVFAIFRKVDADMSEWKETSPLSEVNRRAGDGTGVPVPDDLRAVIRRGIEFGDLTGGAFDITWASLWGLWDFKTKEPALPDPAEIARRSALVDYTRVVVDDDSGSVRLTDRSMKIGLGGIAKGYALDLSAAALRRLGRTSFMLSAGGHIYAAGRKGERRWRVGIRDPRGERDDYFALFEAEDRSVSTSGDYESYFELEGVRYHHILDPATGMPSHGLRGATVISPGATTADALSTSLLVLGLERGLDLIESLDGVEAVVVDSAGSIYSTSGADAGLVIRHQPAK